MKTLVIYSDQRDLLVLCERLKKSPKEFSRIDAMDKGHGFRDALVVCLPHWDLSFRNAGECIETKRSLERRGCVFVSIDSEALSDRSFDLARYLEELRPK